MFAHVDTRVIIAFTFSLVFSFTLPGVKMNHIQQEKGLIEFSFC